MRVRHAANHDTKIEVLYFDVRKIIELLEDEEQNLREFERLRQFCEELQFREALL